MMSSETDESTLYDVHMHAFNLSHPYLLAFVRRFKGKLGALLCFSPTLPLLAKAPDLWPAAASFMESKIDVAQNLLSVMENDIGSFFLLIENCLREGKDPPLRGDGLHIGDRVYERIILTPLMMDFGYKGKTPPGQKKPEKTFYYDIPASKPIKEQVTDVFNGIKDYAKTLPSEKLSKKFPALGSAPRRMLEIYPFLGLNSQNYEYDEIDTLLDKYFGEKALSKDELLANMGRFDGDIEHMTTGSFAGVKVYPPLGFDPWPNGKYGDAEELRKVKLLYSRCCEKNIPITAHGGTGGFVTVDKKRLRSYASVEKWEKVLAAFPNLRLNLAHLPMDEKTLWFVPNPLHPLRNAYMKLVLNHEDAYIDFSCQVVDDEYFVALAKALRRLPSPERKKLSERILFGSDFAVNLLGIESYSKCLTLYSKTKALTEGEKHAFCCLNPGRFLFPPAALQPQRVEPYAFPTPS